MSTFLLPNGKAVTRNASYCVAIFANGRWTHKWFKTLHGANNEIKFWRGASADTKAYYGIDNFHLVRGNCTA
jgi:hypothetical protein